MNNINIDGYQHRWTNSTLTFMCNGNQLLITEQENFAVINGIIRPFADVCLPKSISSSCFVGLELSKPKFVSVF